MEKKDKSAEPPRYVILKRSKNATVDNPVAVAQENRVVERVPETLDVNNEGQQPPQQDSIANLERIRQKIDLFRNMNEAVVDHLLFVRHIFFELGLNALFEADEDEEEEEYEDEDEDSDEEGDDNNNPAPAA